MVRLPHPKHILCLFALHALMFIQPKQTDYFDVNKSWASEQKHQRCVCLFVFHLANSGQPLTKLSTSQSLSSSSTILLQLQLAVNITDPLHRSLLQSGW